jgi:hypothetical protein
MEAADETRKHWASLLAGRDQLHHATLGSWLDLAARALAWNPTAAAPLDFSQGSLSNSFLSPMQDSMARLGSHPAAVMGGDASPARLPMEAGRSLNDFLQSVAAHQVLQSQGWLKAFQKISGEFMGPPKAGGRDLEVGSLDAFVTHCGAVGEAALQEHSRSEQFLDSQAKTLRTAMRFRSAQRRAMESAARAIDLPTLTDVDEAFEAIHSLRREVRELRRLTRTSAAEPVAARPAPTPSKQPVASASRRARSLA